MLNIEGLAVQIRSNCVVHRSEYPAVVRHPAIFKRRYRLFFSVKIFFIHGCDFCDSNKQGPGPFQGNVPHPLRKKWPLFHKIKSTFPETGEDASVFIKVFGHFLSSFKQKPQNFEQRFHFRRKFDRPSVLIIRSVTKGSFSSIGWSAEFHTFPQIHGRIA